MYLRRIVVLLLMAAMVLPAALAASPALAGSQTGSDDDLFQTYLASIDGVMPVAGPMDGELALDGSESNSQSLGVDLADALIQVDFTVPEVADGMIWAVSVAFRQRDEGFHYLVIWPDGAWSFAPFGGGAIQSGGGVVVGPAGTTVGLSIVAAGDTAYVGIDGAYLTTLDLSSSVDPGDITLSANLIGTADQTMTLGYSGFAAWALESGSLTPAIETPVATVAPTETGPAPTVTPTEAAPVPTVAPTEAAPAPTVAPTEAAPAPTEAATEAAVPTLEPVQETPAAPAADDEAVFNAYLRQSLSSPILHGPESGTIVHEPDVVTFYDTGVEATDFIARIECLAGRSAAEGFWDCGIIFRSGEGGHYRLGYVSDGYWFHSQGPEQPLASGNDGPVLSTADAKVVLNLVAVGDKGYFGINDQFISALDLSGITTGGRIELASAFYADTYIENGGVAFEDFIVWSLDEEVAQPSPTAGGIGLEPTPTTEGGFVTATADQTPVTAETPVESPTTELVGVTGSQYTSPTYGYSLTWPAGWSVDSSSSDGSVDILGLSNTSVLVDLIGEPWAAADGSCFDRLLLYYQGNAEYSDIQGAMDSASAAPGIWDITGIITMNYTNESGETTAYVNYVSCSAIPGQEAIVTLEQFVPVTEFGANSDAMDELRGSFSIGGGGLAPAATVTPGTTLTDPTATPGFSEPTATPGFAAPTSTPGFSEPTATAGTGTVVETPTTTAGQQTVNVVGNTYTSPTFGYSLTWDETWQVVAEESTEGIDFLRISTDTLTADLYAAASENSPQQCIDELFNYYVNDELYTNVTYATGSDGQPILQDFGTYAHAVISFTRTLDNGQTIEQFSEATCFRMDQPGAVVILEVYMPPADYVLQRGAISALQEGLVVPGQPAVQIPEVAQTPVAVTTEEAGTETVVAPPEVETVESVTFFLAPVGNSGIQGTGTIEAQPRLVTVTAIVIGGSPGDTVTIQRGSCSTIGSGAEPDYIVGELDETGLLRSDLRVRLAALVGEEPYSVVVYPSGDEFTQALACGEIS